MKITDLHAMGYSGYCDGYWATPEEAIAALAINPQTQPKQAEAVTRGMGLARMDMEMMIAECAERMKRARGEAAGRAKSTPSALATTESDSRHHPTHQNAS